MSWQLIDLLALMSDAVHILSAVGVWRKGPSGTSKDSWEVRPHLLKMMMFAVRPEVELIVHLFCDLII